MRGFPTNLFDFDFETESENRMSVTAAIEERERCRSVLMADEERLVELPEVIDVWIDSLERMALRAVDESRMGAYFRIVESLMKWSDMERFESGLNRAF